LIHCQCKTFTLSTNHKLSFMTFKVDTIKVLKKYLSNGYD
jgi:hypothetical protein